MRSPQPRKWISSFLLLMNRAFTISKPRLASFMRPGAIKTKCQPDLLSRVWRDIEHFPQINLNNRSVNACIAQHSPSFPHPKSIALYSFTKRSLRLIWFYFQENKAHPPVFTSKLHYWAGSSKVISQCTAMAAFSCIRTRIRVFCRMSPISWQLPPAPGGNWLHGPIHDSLQKSD